MAMDSLSLGYEAFDYLGLGIVASLIGLIVFASINFC